MPREVAVRFREKPFLCNDSMITMRSYAAMISGKVRGILPMGTGERDPRRARSVTMDPHLHTHGR